ncbi:HAD-IIIC family phosphatase [Aurantimonas marianensis]|uniref:HAD-IIIC family phosphatase n=1 Tax=Aurantimonas marianensis TaxID=2920428 RepID=A0A9X2H495_9HYPH|nr:HAD-IIIC family phosphatase [Aurantimonas marianensis]MCP3054997.1 HAD-IIIC family phosphatase [Aurantimonas marianensis]
MPTDSHAWWSFAPAAAPPDAAAIREAAEAGRGALSRVLREARHRLGTARAATLLRDAGVGAALRPVRLFLVTSYQPRAIDDALRLAFAIAGFDLETVAVEGLAEAAGRALDAAGQGRFDGAILSIAATGTKTVHDETARVAASLAEVLQCPVAIIGDAKAGTDDAAEGVFHSPVAPDLAGNAPLFDTRFAASLGTIPSERGAEAIADTAAGVAARIMGTAPKLLITDLDDTLWRGVAGENGDLALHAAYAAALASLSERGLVLAAASRNEAEVAREALADLARDAPSGVPRFSALAVDWADKADLVAALLDQLGLAAEHTLFVDDDPVNCALVAARFPAMDVRRFADPDGFAAMLLADPLLAAGERPVPLETRAALYQRRADVERLRAAEPDAAAFLERLETRLTILPLDAASRPRAAELARRVNQFVLTAERPNEMELSRRSNALDFLVRLDDVFGGHGIVGLVLADRDGEAVVIRNLYLSCRALQRRVETAMLAVLCRRAAAVGARRIIGVVEQMERNRPARGLFAEAGFRQDGGRWVLDVDPAAGTPGVAAPPGLTIDDRTEGS